MIILASGTLPTESVSEGRSEMSCKLCQSHSANHFSSGINIHFPGKKNLSKPSVWAFPKPLVCLNCGFTEFVLEEPELIRLRDDDSTQLAAGNGQALGI